MPWTLAHPAAVLPLRRLADAGYLSFPALLIGCFTPDVVYHLGRWDLGGLTHTPFGVLCFDVPIGALLLGACAALRGPVAQRLPEPHRSVLLALRCVPADSREAGIMGLSLAIGAASHCLWDACTHATGSIVQAFAWLGWPVPFPGREIRVYSLLQHGGSLVGVVALAVAYHGHCLRTTGLHPWRLAGLGWTVAMAGAALALALPFAWAESIAATGQINLHRLVVRQVAYSTSAFLGLMALMALFSWRRTRPLAARPSHR